MSGPFHLSKEDKVLQYYFSGVASKQELNWLLEAGIRRILVDPVQWRQVVSKADLPEDMHIALDSGAYRAFRKGQEQLMPLAEYEAIAMSYPFDFVVSPDVIGNWQRSYWQWKQAIELIDAPLIPVWQWGAPTPTRGDASSISSSWGWWMPALATRQRGEPNSDTYS